MMTLSFATSHKPIQSVSSIVKKNELLIDKAVWMTLKKKNTLTKRTQIQSCKYCLGSIFNIFWNMIFSVAENNLIALWQMTLEVFISGANTAVRPMRKLRMMEKLCILNWPHRYMHLWNYTQLCLWRCVQPAVCGLHVSQELWMWSIQFSVCGM